MDKGVEPPDYAELARIYVLHGWDQYQQACQRILDEACKGDYSAEALYKRAMVTAPSPLMRRHVADLFSQMPHDWVEWVFENCWFIAVSDLTVVCRCWAAALPPSEKPHPLYSETHFAAIIFPTRRWTILMDTDHWQGVENLQEHANLAINLFHEIAHAWLDHRNGGTDKEEERQAQALAWDWMHQWDEEWAAKVRSTHHDPLLDGPQKAEDQEPDSNPWQKER